MQLKTWETDPQQRTPSGSVRNLPRTEAGDTSAVSGNPEVGQNPIPAPTQCGWLLDDKYIFGKFYKPSDLGGAGRLYRYPR